MGKPSRSYNPADLDAAQAAFDIALKKVREIGAVDCSNDRVQARLARLTLGAAAKGSTPDAVAEHALREFKLQQLFIDARAKE